MCGDSSSRHVDQITTPCLREPVMGGLRDSLPLDTGVLSVNLFFVLLRRTFLGEQLSQDVAEMLLVVRREVEEDGSWLNSDKE